MIKKVYKNTDISVYIADKDSILRPFPAKDDLLLNAKSGEFTLNAGKKGKTAFQIIVESSKDIEIKSVSGKGIYCFSTEGSNVYGEDFSKTMPIYAEKPWPLWCHFDPKESDEDKINIELSLTDGRKICFNISISLSDEFNSSLYDKDSLLRLEWLNSKRGTEKTLTDGFDPIKVSKNLIRISGRDISVSNNGSIEAIKTYFVGNNSEFSDTPREMLKSPMGYEIFENGEKLRFETVDFLIKQEDETECVWTATNKSGDISLVINGKAEFDGAVRIDAKISGAKDKKLSVRFVYNPRPEFSKYFMGLGKQGGVLPEEHIWRWDKHKHQNSMWAGSVNGGVFIRPTSYDACRPFVNIYYHHSRNHIPSCWENDGKGYFSLKNQESTEMFFESGEFLADDSITFSVECMISPFKKINMEKHWNTHYYHKNFNTPYTEEDIKDAVSNGCTHINLHHGNDTLPFLNYPMYDIEPLKELSNLAHENGLGFKPYYTVRELTTRLPELFCLRSLRDEIFSTPTYNQGGVSWQNGVDDFITENFGDEVIPAWKHTFDGGKFDGTTDPTVITNSMSRISNFYIESINWLIENVGIDGLYIDDAGYDRTVLRRVLRVFNELKPDAKIDLHTWNHYEDEYGAAYGHNMLIYMELLPYLSSLWVGESYDYDAGNPEYLLTEVSGIPFGIMSEMLEGKCNVWRGMLFGMTSRYPYYKWYQGPSPVPLWEMRKPFERAKMIGFWEDKKPIDTDNENVKITSYYDKENDRYLLAIANFGEEDTYFTLTGDTDGRRIYAPFVEGIQNEYDILNGEKISISQKGGALLIAE